MALRVSPERVRDVRFAEQWRGYRTDEVDEFVDRVAEAFDELEGRLQEAAERTALAERRLQERGPDDELSRTLVLAQRTADAALEEAQAEASRLLADAEERARSILDDVEVRKAKLEQEMEARVQAELAEVSERRAALEADVEALRSYVERNRTRLAEELRTQLGWLDRAGHLEPLDAPPGPGPTPPPDAAVEAPRDHRPTRRGDEPAGPGSSGGSGRATEGPIPAVDAGWDDAAPAEALPGEGLGGGGEQDDHTARNHTARDHTARDDTVLDDLDSLPWRGAAVADDAVAGDNGDTGDSADIASDDGNDDPFITELRRAVDDPEPLGPRDEPGQWVDHGDIYDRHRDGPMRSRRRRRRP